ncbi:hypothetical protein HMN09_00054900 [Mycena chlorophos]|uniref:Uncharacterized protein n=1 Tax=Mycena chlorophos TaxID=658473 RepID=A0A8H6TTG1_MYCCL|nr:hypothetical protein HMN09_00054900 [Mycena chlorophos]
MPSNDSFLARVATPPPPVVLLLAHTDIPKADMRGLLMHDDFPPFSKSAAAPLKPGPPPPFSAKHITSTGPTKLKGPAATVAAANAKSNGVGTKAAATASTADADVRTIPSEATSTATTEAVSELSDVEASSKTTYPPLIEVPGRGASHVRDSELTRIMGWSAEYLEEFKVFVRNLTPRMLPHGVDKYNNHDKAKMAAFHEKVAKVYPEVKRCVDCWPVDTMAIGYFKLARQAEKKVEKQVVTEAIKTIKRAGVKA